MTDKQKHNIIFGIRFFTLHILNEYLAVINTKNINRAKFLCDRIGALLTEASKYHEA